MLRRALWWTCLLLSTAHADEVFLRQGGRLRGHVEQDFGGGVTVLHASGQVRARSDDVQRIRREPRARTLWLQARQADQAGERAHANRLLRRLVALEDGPYALKARRELQEQGREALLGPQPVTALTAGQALELSWRALACDEVDLATEAALQAYGPSLESRGRLDERRVEYVLARTHELRGHPRTARTLYEAIVSGADTDVPEDLPDDLLRLLARLHAAGTPVEPIPPGATEPWRLSRGPRVTLLHQGDGPRLVEATERALTRVATLLDLPRTEDGQRVLLVLFPDARSYAASAAYLDSSAGFAHRASHGGEVDRSAVLVEGDVDTLHHELAHVVTGDALAGHRLPR